MNRRGLFGLLFGAATVPLTKGSMNHLTSLPTPPHRVVSLMQHVDARGVSTVPRELAAALLRNNEQLKAEIFAAIRRGRFM